jgi:hypothetical protein
MTGRWWSKELGPAHARLGVDVRPDDDDAITIEVDIQPLLGLSSGWIFLRWVFTRTSWAAVMQDMYDAWFQKQRDVLPDELLAVVSYFDEWKSVRGSIWPASKPVAEFSGDLGSGRVSLRINSSHHSDLASFVVTDGDWVEIVTSVRNLWAGQDSSLEGP